MTSITKYTTPTAAGTEVDARARRYVSEHQGSTFREAVNAVLASDRQLASAYAAPSPRRARMADKRSQPVVPVTPADEAEIQDWVIRALDANMAGLLPGALGQLSLEAYALAKTGMPAEEAVRRAMDLFPHLVALAKALLVDIRRNEKPEQGNPAGFEVHVRAEALMQKHPHMDYREAVGAVLSEDTQLKARYAGVQHVS